MCYNWYTRIDIIRTLRGDIRQREALVSFLVIDHDLQVIIEDINSIDERLNDVAAEERIGAVAFGELMKEEKNAVPVEELILRVAHHLDRGAEIFGSIFEILQHGGGGRIPDAGGDSVIDVLDLLLCILIFCFHG